MATKPGIRAIELPARASMTECWGNGYKLKGPWLLKIDRRFPRS